MRGRALLTFATKEDWSLVLHGLESQQEIQYIVSGSAAERIRKTYPTFLALPDFAIAQEGDSTRECRYLVIQRGASVSVRKVNLNSGSARYVADHENNPDSFVLVPGGILLSAKAIISGEISMLSQTPVAKTLYDVAANQVRKYFRAFGAYRVGPRAAELGQKGFRLTAGVQNPKSYDLALKS